MASSDNNKVTAMDASKFAEHVGTTQAIVQAGGGYPPLTPRPDLDKVNTAAEAAMTGDSTAQVYKQVYGYSDAEFNTGENSGQPPEVVIQNVSDRARQDGDVDMVSAAKDNTGYGTHDMSEEEYDFEYSDDDEDIVDIVGDGMQSLDENRSRAAQQVVS